MIPHLSSALCLGRDAERMHPKDAARQEATVDRLLQAFFTSERDRREIQILADEVGLGKTFVATATAYSVLEALRRGEDLPGLDRSYRCTLVVTPKGNHALAEKWVREVEALVERCAAPGEGSWFRPRRCSSVDELLQAILRADDLRRRGEGVVLVAEAGVFTKRLADPAVRFMTACLFRWWGNALPNRERHHVVRGLAELPGSGDWSSCTAWISRGEYDVALWDWAAHRRFLESSDSEREQFARWEQWLYGAVTLTWEDVKDALDRQERAGADSHVKELLSRCKAVRQRTPGDRRTVQYKEWRESLEYMKSGLRDVYRSLWPFLLRKRFPLVIADEAHHWRNQHRADCSSFRELIAPFTQRLLLLTATPFQLHREEILSVLSTSDAMRPAIGDGRQRELAAARERLSSAMQRAETAGMRFSKTWGELARDWTAPAAASTTESDPRTVELGRRWGDLSAGGASLDDLPGHVRPFFSRAQEYRSAVDHLGRVMGQLVIRHRRETIHRHYLVGREYPSLAVPRPDQHQLHRAAGTPTSESAELAQFLLMRVVAEADAGRRRTALGMDLTGSYTTLWSGNEGRRALERLPDGAAPLRKVLADITGHTRGRSTRDHEHPKVRLVVDEVVQRWERGEKSLVFCFRLPTAGVIHRLVEEEIGGRLARARSALLRARGTSSRSDTDEAIQQFRRSLTARDGSGISLFLDHVLVGWLDEVGVVRAAWNDGDRAEIAALWARAYSGGEPLFRAGKRPDRVFLLRAAEHVLARRLLAEGLKAIPEQRREESRDLLAAIADESWVRLRYGVQELTRVESRADGTAEHHARGSLAARFELTPNPDSEARRTAVALLATGRSALESLFGGANLFAPRGEAVAQLPGDARVRAADIRRLLFAITRKDGSWSWQDRAATVDAVVRALLREDLLLRMPREVFAGDDERWADSLFRGLHTTSTKAADAEPLAERVRLFLLDLSGKSKAERDAQLGYAMKTSARAVVLVTGETKDREPIFSGFDSPLLPEILVCTAVGQEGIDLHRYCRHVVHYDLGWNPATIEQRTGRVDRIGSQVARERDHAVARGVSERDLPSLDIALPYLAGTYDERMFSVLLERAQVFDILTGGNPTIDSDSEESWSATDEGPSQGGAGFIPLPPDMLEALKVHLSVAYGEHRHVR